MWLSACGISNRSRWLHVASAHELGHTRPHKESQLRWSLELCSSRPQSTTICRYQPQSVAVARTQLHSAALSRTQPHSAALSCTQLHSAYSAAAQSQPTGTKTPSHLTEARAASPGQPSCFCLAPTVPLAGDLRACRLLPECTASADSCGPLARRDWSEQQPILLDHATRAARAAFATAAPQQELASQRLRRSSGEAHITVAEAARTRRA